MTDSAEADTGQHANERVRGQLWRGGEAVDGFDIDAISDCLDADDPDTLIWADLECPTHETLSRVASELDLDPFAVEDTVAAAERVKTVMYSGHTFVMVYAIALHDGDAGQTEADDVADDQPTTNFGPSANGRARMFDLHRISIFIKRNVLITVRPTPDFDMDEVVRRWAESGAMQYGMGALVHGLLDVVVDGHFDAVQRLDDEIEDLEALLFDERVPGRELQRRTYDLRKDLVVLRRVVLPMREVIAGIQRRRLENHAPPELDPPLLRSLRPRPARDRVDGVVAGHDHHRLRDEPDTRRRAAEHRDEEADRLGRDHRGTDRDHRFLRTERAVPGVSRQRRFHHEHLFDSCCRAGSLHLLPTPRLVVTRR
ncbi:putative metal ion transporter [Gordonia namibiensis NBRC 108229]|uniref:Putative metal ion transporter n=1 Tax=Gordonia namibiensis NBRC 108229 TaxID=1208314 RepID=K6WNH0_9ACTN|nr:putative metal ion transporter [Gordonia namibiensis NBRC 108229]